MIKLYNDRTNQKKISTSNVKNYRLSLMKIILWIILVLFVSVNTKNLTQ